MMNLNKRSDAVSRRPRKIQVLNEIVKVLRDHITERDNAIGGLEGQIFLSKAKIKLLEDELQDEDQIKSNHNFPEKIEFEPNESATDCIVEHEPFPDGRFQVYSYSSQGNDSEGMKELIRSSSNEIMKSDIGHEILFPKRDSTRLDNEMSLTEMKLDHKALRGKLERMYGILAENLILQADLADYKMELNQLRYSTKQLRSRCHQLAESNHQNRAEISDLRRYIELLKANKEGDTRQDLLNKIEYYQMEHERLLDEIRRLNLRLCEISPQISPKSITRQNINLDNSMEFEIERETGCRSPVSNAMAASTASSLAAGRLLKDRSLSPTAALNYRSLTMDRYRQHMDDEVEKSLHSDDTEILLDSQANRTSSFGRENEESFDGDYETKTDRESHPSNVFAGDDELSREMTSNSKSENSDSNICSISNSTPQGSSTPNQQSGSLSSSNPSRRSLTSSKSLPTRAFAPRSPADLTLDSHWIKFTRPGGKMRRGVVKFVGHLANNDGIYVGVEVDDGDGEHSGTFRGTKYFSCEKNKGLFTPFGKIVMAWE